ncbi:hypothetical protein [Marinicellulosiphila megalodicopiae]|uniref:hypothetical protein n=1 Tax=Marinicellulosiphila megalodicopiae TaxID=2724896 RepID=UPI003BB0AB28
MQGKISKPNQAIIGSAFGVVVCLGLYMLMINRGLPFLKDEFVVMHGQNIATPVYIESTAPMFLYAIPVFVIVGLVNFFILKKRENKG